MVKKIIVAPSQTLFVAGTLTAGTQLVVDAGTATQPGGVVEVRGHAANKGHVFLYGSGAPGVSAASGTIAAGGTLFNQGEITLEPGAPTSFDSGIYGAGASATVFGVLTNEGAIYLKANANGAVLDIAAGGVLTNQYGRINASGGGSFSGLPIPGFGATIIDSGTLANAIDGTLNLYGGSTPQASGATTTGASMQVTGVLTNERAGIVRIWGAGEGAPTSGLATGGSLVIAAGGYFYNAGVVDVRAVQSTSSQGFGNTSTGGLLTVAGTMVNAGFLQLDGGQGEIGSTQQGATMVVTGLFTNNGSVTVAQGNDLTGPGGAGLGAMLLVEGTMINDRLAYPQYAALTVYGGSGTKDPSHPATGGTVSVSGTLDNVTGIRLDAGYAYSRPGYSGGLGAQLTDSGFILNQSTIYVALGVTGASATFEITGTLTNDGGSITGGGVVTNNGTINALHTATIGAVGGNGAIDVESGATLTFAGAVGAGQRIALAAGATLNLGSAQDFQGVFTNIAAGATIDFIDMHIATAYAAAGALTLTNGSAAPLMLQLGAAAPGFSLVSDGHGGTDLTFQSTHG
jgi:hypothetical protein